MVVSAMSEKDSGAIAEQSFKDNAQAKQYRGFPFTPRYCAAVRQG